jgi:hypothetical protein
VIRNEVVRRSGGDCALRCESPMALEQISGRERAWHSGTVAADRCVRNASRSDVGAALPCMGGNGVRLFRYLARSRLNTAPVFSGTSPMPIITSWPATKARTLKVEKAASLYCHRPDPIYRRRGTPREVIRRILKSAEKQPWSSSSLILRTRMPFAYIVL